MSSTKSDSDLKPEYNFSPPNLHNNRRSRKQSTSFRIFEDNPSEPDAEGDSDPAYEWDPSRNDWVPSAWGLQYDAHVSQIASSGPSITASHSRVSSNGHPPLQPEDPFVAPSRRRKPLQETTKYPVPGGSGFFEAEPPPDTFLSRLDADPFSNVIGWSREQDGGDTQNSGLSTGPQDGTPNYGRPSAMESAVNPGQPSLSPHYEFAGGPSHRATSLSHRRDIDPDHRYTNLFWEEGVVSLFESRPECLLRAVVDSQQGYRGQIPREQPMDLHDENDENSLPAPPLPENQEENQMDIEPRSDENGEMDVDIQTDENELTASGAGLDDPRTQGLSSDPNSVEEKSQPTDSSYSDGSGDSSENEEPEAAGGNTEDLDSDSDGDFEQDDGPEPPHIRKTRATPRKPNQKQRKEVLSVIESDRDTGAQSQSSPEGVEEEPRGFSDALNVGSMQEYAAQNARIRLTPRASSTATTATVPGRITRAASRRSSANVSFATPSSQTGPSPKGSSGRSTRAASLVASAPESGPTTRSRARRILSESSEAASTETYSPPKTRGRAKGGSTK